MKTLLALSVLLCGAPARAYDAIHFLEPIKSPEMLRPVAAAVHDSRLYVLDEKRSALLVCELGGRLRKAVGRKGTDKSSFDSPRGVAVGPDGRVYVADTGNSRIRVLDGDGEPLWSFGTRGSERGMLRSPQSVAVGGDGRVYVADTGNDRVQVFTAEGILLYVFGSKGKEGGRFKEPTKVVVDPADNIYVLDSGNERIQKFDPSARFAREFGAQGNDFAVDAYGFFYELDAGNGKVIERGPDDAVLGRFGSIGSGVGQFKKPEGIAVAPDGMVLVLDAGNSRIQRAEVSNKLKTELLAPNLQTKLTVSGPSRSWQQAASALAPFGDELYAYLPLAGQFAVFDGEGRVKARFGAKGGQAPGGVSGTQGFAVSKKLGVYVSDTPANRIQRFAIDGTFQDTIAASSGLFDSKKKEGRVKDPRGVAINDAGTVYVADAGNRRIDAFSPEGAFLFGFGPQVGPYTLVEPTALAWDQGRFLYFTDKGLKKVFQVEPSGAFIAAWGEEGEGPGQFQSPSALAFDGHNYLYVLDDRLSRVSVYTKDGRWLTDFFAPGPAPRELSGPTAVAIQGERLLVADYGKARIVTYDLHPHLAAPVSISSSTKEGVVSLSWQAVADPWTAGYLVSRSTDPAGPFGELGQVEKPRFQDSTAAADASYWYVVATVAKTKDLGPLSRPFPVTVPAASNKAPVEISTATIGNIFSANYKWYLKNPVGKVKVTNNVNVPFQSLKLTFRLKEFMDFGYDTEIKRLEARESVEVPLIATLNNKILEVSEDTPVQAEFTLTYFENGKQETVSLTKPLRVYSRNAITWEEPRRIANFLTPKDPPVREFAVEALRDRPRCAAAGALNPNLVTAMHLWEALSEAGVRFQSNPSNPYEATREDANFPVDYAQFPRETLKRKSGQCDDLSTLLVSMLTGANVRSAILDYPGHMALMFDTETDDPAEAGLPGPALVKYQGTYWIPLEATMLGSSFAEAYRKALYAYKTEDEKGRVRVLDPRQAWESFEPATLPEAAAVNEAPKADARAKRFTADAEDFAGQRYEFLKKLYTEQAAADVRDASAHVQLGLLEYQRGDSTAAAAEYDKALALDPKDAAALNNLAGLSYLAGDFAQAEARYLQAADADGSDAELWLNLVKTGVRLQDKAKARGYADKALALDGSLKPAVETLLGDLK
ncbi:MAG: tetratricopeptide repeat protein [Elusimicrobia bacterium]|nr:tetratricopeptide repeat protein [Elusimicrobiota bacterium]